MTLSDPPRVELLFLIELTQLNTSNIFKNMTQNKQQQYIYECIIKLCIRVIN